MKEGPDIALLGSLIGDPARANILIALMSGKALTVSELAVEAGVTLQTTSSHLKKLEDVGLVCQRKQGRHRYFTLADDDVGAVMEAMMGLAAKRGLVRINTGPKDAALRKARICYNHLAGDLGIRLYDGLVSRGNLVENSQDITLSDQGAKTVENFGINLAELSSAKRPLCKPCLDWSARRTHLAGSLGSAFLKRFIELGWASPVKNSRAIKFTLSGETAFLRKFAA